MTLSEQTSSESAPTAPDHARPASASDFDLSHEVAALRRGPQYAATGHAAKTLFRRPALRVVLIALGRHEELKEHRTSQPVLIQTLDGTIRVALPERAVEPGVGGLVVVESGVAHDVIALTDSAFLVSMPWSEQSDS